MVIIEDSRQQAGKHEVKHERFSQLGDILIRSKLPFGDYALPPKIAVDTKETMNEIAQNIEAMIGTTGDTAPTAAPKHPISETTTSKFASLNLQFGRNYDPKSK